MHVLTHQSSRLIPVQHPQEATTCSGGSTVIFFILLQPELSLFGSFVDDYGRQGQYFIEGNSSPNN
jgi:hypothetical protein